MFKGAFLLLNTSIFDIKFLKDLLPRWLMINLVFINSNSTCKPQTMYNVQRNVNIRLSRSPPGTCWQTIVLKCSPHQDSHYQTFPFRKCENVFILETALEAKKNYSMVGNVQSWRRYCDRFWDVEEAEVVRKLRIDDLSETQI